MTRRPGVVIAALIAILLSACAGSGAPSAASPMASLPVLTPQTSGTTALLQAVSPVSEQVVWVSGHRGTWGRTTDGGNTWVTGTVPGEDSLQFRDVHAEDANTAWLMSAGSGSASRIYHTRDAGRTWELQFTNTDPDAFYDCLDFWDDERGVAFSDASRGRTVVLATRNGRDWTYVPSTAVPAPLPNEGSFAASGTCLVTVGERHGWIGTGNSTVARVFRTADGGRTWTAAPTPIVTGEAAGIASVAFRDTLNGAAMGGALNRPGDFTDNVAITRDGGRTWALAGRPSFPGAIYGGAWVPGAARPVLVAVGPGGASLAHDDARTWTVVDTVAYWAVGFASPRAGWAVGPKGRITRISLE